MKKLTYDTETTGLPIWGSPSEHPDQPRIISLAADLHDETGRTFGALNVLIKPDGWTVPDEITALTGISTAMCEAYGVPMADVLPVFMRMHAQADERIGHNESFDMRMIRIELMRDLSFGPSPADEWKAAPAYCTMGNCIKIVNLPPSAKMVAAGKKTPKSPNLSEAYKHFTGLDIIDAHSAWADVQACKAVYLAIQKLNVGAPA